MSMPSASVLSTYKEFIMSSVSSVVSSTTSSYDLSGMQRRQRPDTSTMAADLFSKLDTSNKGYIEQSDLTSALSSLSSTSSSGSTSSTVSASDIFSQLDSNSDGKVTKDELTSSLKKLADELDSQFNQMRMQGGMPPPPPTGTQGTDTGFTKDELSSQLSEIGSSDAQRSSLITKIVENFDKADTDGNGKVSFQEAMAYDQATSTTSTTTGTSSTASSASSTSASGSTTDAQMFRQLMDLLRAYGSEGQSSNALTSLTSLISTSA